MSHPRRRPRTSRVLLLILGLTVAIGVVAFVSRYRNNRAVADSGNTAPPPAAPAVTPAVVADDPDAALVTQTPTAKPATQPRSPTASRVTQNTSTATTKPTTRKSSPNASGVLLSSKPLADAKAKVEAKQLLEARDIYNAALLSGKLTEDEELAAKQAMAGLNEAIVFSPRRFKEDPWADTVKVPSG